MVINEEYDTGLGTTSNMWDLLSEIIDGEELPDSLNQAIYLLKDDKAKIVRKW